MGRHVATLRGTRPGMYVLVAYALMFELSVMTFNALALVPLPSALLMLPLVLAVPWGDMHTVLYTIWRVMRWVVIHVVTRVRGMAATNA